MKRIILTAVLIVPLLFNIIQAKSGKFNKTFPEVDLVKIEIDIGNLELTSNSSDEITVKCKYDLSDETYYSPSVSVYKNYLGINGKVEGRRGNKFMAKVNWIITVPHLTKIEFETTSGEVTIEDFNGEFSGQTGPGGIEIINSDGKFNFKTNSGHIFVDDSRGVFDLTSKSGKVNVYGVILNDKSNFCTESGNIKVRLSETPEYDLSISTKSGQAMLDYNGNKVRGYFEMSGIMDQDYIECPFEFENERHIRMGGPGTSQKVIKSFTMESDKPFIEINSFPGPAILKE